MYTLGILLGTMILISIIPLKLEMKIIKNHSDDKVMVHIYIVKGMIGYRIEIPFIELKNKQGIPFIHTKVKEKSKQSEETLEEDKKNLTPHEIKRIKEKITAYFRKYHHTLEYVFRHIKLAKWIWNVEFGTVDAAATGLLSGFFFTAQGVIASIIKNYTECKDMSMNVVPKFNHKIFNTDFYCIFQMKLGYIIIATMKFLILWLKGGEKNVQSSY